MTLLANATIAKWFVAKEGRAVALANLGSQAGAALAPPIDAAFVATGAWRVGFPLWAA